MVGCFLTHMLKSRDDGECILGHFQLELTEMDTFGCEMLQLLSAVKEWTLTLSEPLRG